MAIAVSVFGIPKSEILACFGDLGLDRFFGKRFYLFKFLIYFLFLVIVFISLELNQKLGSFPLLSSIAILELNIMKKRM